MFHHKENILLIKVEKFTDRIIKLAAYLKSKNVDPYIINQVSRAGTSIGANLNEGVFAQSRADFISKYSIALKEANETSFWLRKLYTGDFLSQKEFDSINNDCNEIIYILIAIIKKMKENGV